MENSYTSRQSNCSTGQAASILEVSKRQRTGFKTWQAPFRGQGFYSQTQTRFTNQFRNPQVKPRPQKPRPPDQFSVVIPDTNTELIFKKGSVTDFHGESIVNAANESCLGGGGVDGAITSKGGTELAAARKKLPILYDNVRVPTGDARLTIGGKLNASYCIHAVGPDFRSIKDPYVLLDAAYTSILREAKTHRITEIAFIPLSSGIFSGGEPTKKIIKKGLQTLVNEVYMGLEKVYMYGFKDEEMAIFHELYLKLQKMFKK